MLRIAGIARSEGPGPYTLGSVVFTPLETAQRVVGTDEINIVRISAPGGVRDSLEAAARAAPVVRDVVGSLAVPVSLDVREAKAAEAANAEEFTIFIRALLVGMSALVAAAGAALIVNLIGMLAEERRSRLGVLRALGLKRRGLVGLAVIEGGLYSLAAGVVGVGVGAAAGRIVAERFGRAFAEFSGDNLEFHFFFTLDPATLVAGFAAGTLLTLGVVYLAARRTARMTVTAAIRDLPEPPREATHRRRTRVAGFSLAGLGGVAGIASAQPFLRTIGGIALVLVAASLARGLLSPRTHATLTGLALAGWSFTNIAAESGPEEDAGTFFLVFVTAMLTSVFGLTVLAAANLKAIETGAAFLGRASSGLRAVLRHHSRTSLGARCGPGSPPGSSLSSLGCSPCSRCSSSSSSPTTSSSAGVTTYACYRPAHPGSSSPPRFSQMSTARCYFPRAPYVGPVASDDEFSTTERAFVPLFEIPPTVAEDPPVRLEQRSASYASDAAAWEAVAQDPSLVVANFACPTGGSRSRRPGGPSLSPWSDRRLSGSSTASSEPPRHSLRSARPLSERPC